VYVKEILFAPKHPGQCLTHYARLIFADAGRDYCLIERIGLASAIFGDLVESAAERVPKAASLSRSRMTAVSPAPTFS
jgi:hypothetical protein